MAASRGRSLIDWISDARPQGYTDLQSLVKCLDYTGIVSDTVCSHARLCQAARCIEMHLGGYVYSHVEPLTITEAFVCCVPDRCCLSEQLSLQALRL